MTKDGTYGDQITLQAAADMYNIEILAVSTVGPDATTLIAPPSSIPTTRFQLGHYAEGHGEHYICIDGGVLLSEEDLPEDRLDEPTEELINEPPEERFNEPPEERVNEPPEERVNDHRKNGSMSHRKEGSMSHRKNK